MAGRGNQLTKQVGEYLVCAELCRMGLISTTFTGNVPKFDILAIDGNSRKIAIQVKTISKDYYQWQLNGKDFINIKQKGKTQSVEGKLQLDNELFYVFVKLVSSGKDEFYIISPDKLQEKIEKQYNEHLKEYDHVRPRNPESTHTAITPSDLSDYKDKWGILSE